MKYVNIVSGWVVLMLFLSRMNLLHMVFQCAGLNAGKIADCASLRLFSSVDEEMLLQSISLTK